MKKIAIIVSLFACLIGHHMTGMSPGQVNQARVRFDSALKNRQWDQAERILKELEAGQRAALATRWRLELEQTRSAQLRELERMAQVAAQQERARVQALEREREKAQEQQAQALKNIQAQAQRAQEQARRESQKREQEAERAAREKGEAAIAQYRTLLERRDNELKAQNEQLIRLNKNLAQCNSNLDENKLAIQSARYEAIQMKNRIAELEAQLAARPAAPTSGSSQAGLINQLQQELNDTRAQAQLAEQRARDVIRSHEEAFAKAQEKFNKDMQEANKIRIELERQLQAQRAAPIPEPARIRELQDEVVNAKAAAEQARQKAEQAQALANQREAEFKRAQEGYKKRIDALQKSIPSIAEQAAQSSQVKAQMDKVSQLSRENENLKRDLAACNDNLKDAEISYKAIQDTLAYERETLGKAKEAFTRREEELDKRYRDVVDQRDELETDLMLANAEKDELEQIRNSLSNVNASLASTIAKMISRLENIELQLTKINDLSELGGIAKNISNLIDQLEKYRQ